ncbi:MAG: GDP-L-fucose synthase [Candidatus Deianiraeaceae bacterium]|jgi:GDP-L-fucose synthase
MSFYASMHNNIKVFLAGHSGFVGKHIYNALSQNSKYTLATQTRLQLDLLKQQEVYEYIANIKPNIVICAATKVGGIGSNINNQAEFLYDNLQIQNNIIHGSFASGIKKLIFLGTSCIYPKHCTQPMKEGHIMQGDFEPTNYGYALAKITGTKMCEFYSKQYGVNYFTICPSNLYGPHDNFNLETSHALSAILYKIHNAKVDNLPFIELWGTALQKESGHLLKILLIQ